MQVPNQKYDGNDEIKSKRQKLTGKILRPEENFETRFHATTRVHVPAENGRLVSHKLTLYVPHARMICKIESNNRLLREGSRKAERQHSKQSTEQTECCV